MQNEISPTSDDTGLPGVMAELSDLKPGAIITEEGIAKLFQRHVVSVKRAVQRGELPPPTKLFGANVWTVESIIRYIESRLADAAQESLKTAHRVTKLAPAAKRDGRL